jgi:hypothetical protein
MNKSSLSSYEDLEIIDIMTDARHGWRKNAKDTSVVAIGEKTHKVLKCEHVTKTDDLHCFHTMPCVILVNRICTFTNELVDG